MTNQTPSASGPKTPRRELLEEAADLIDGDRNVSYGSPTQNFENIAELWNVRFAHMLKDGAKFSAADVADAMILLKVARNIAQQKRDNWADIAGYAGCGYEATLPEESAPKKNPYAKGGMVVGVDPSKPDTFITINTSPDTSAQSIVNGIAEEIVKANKLRNTQR